MNEPKREGLSVSAYVERLVEADRSAEEEIEGLALEGLNSGSLIEIGPGFWKRKHRLLMNASRRPAPGERRPPVCCCAAKVWRKAETSEVSNA